MFHAFSTTPSLANIQLTIYQYVTKQRNGLRNPFFI